MQTNLRHRDRLPAATQPSPGRADPARAAARSATTIYDRLLRKTAEFDNYRKRTDRERQQLAEAAAADLIEDLLPLVDDLERALKADAGRRGDRARSGAASS